MKNIIIKWIKRIVAFVGTFAIFVVIWKAVRYVNYDDTRSYTRVMWHEYYNQDNIDVIFAGASLCFCGIDVHIMDEKLGMNTFDFGVSQQTLQGTYYMVRDAVDRYDVKQVYLELSPNVAQYKPTSTIKSGGKVQSVYLMTDYMKPSILKLEYMYNALNADIYLTGLFVGRRKWDMTFNTDYVKKTIKGKQKESYKTYSYDDLNYNEYRYMGKGYLAGKLVYDSSMQTEDKLVLENISEQWYEYLDKIIEYCQDNGVQITLFNTPLTNDYLRKSLEDYDEYHNIISDEAKEKGINYYDFNLVRDEVMNYTPNNYRDSVHLNQTGAQEFTQLFADVINGVIDSDDVFYSSINEKV